MLCPFSACIMGTHQARIDRIVDKANTINWGIEKAEGGAKVRSERLIQNT